MTADTVHLIVAVAVPLLAGGAAYGGVRQGLKGLGERVRRVEHEADRANERIDRILSRGGTNAHS